jgi:uncharacterized membrane protein YdbT with pleckstrin-like domain
MSYITRSLGRSEALLYRARFPVLYHVVAWSLVVVAVVGAIVADAKGYGWLVIAPLVAGIAACLAIIVPMWTTEIGVTNQRFILKRGLIWRATQELQLRAVEEVNLDQGLLGRLFNFGRLDLRGTGVDDIHLPELADPLGLRKALQDGMAAAGQAAAPSAPMPATQSVA